MTRIHHIVILLLSIFPFLNSCTQKEGQGGGDIPTNIMTEARLISVVDGKGFSDVTITNPWDTTKILQHLCLVDNACYDSLIATATLPADAQIVRVPLQHSLVMSTVHCSLIDELGKDDAIGSVCDASYIKVDAIADRIKDGTIHDCGNSMAPTIERIIEAAPDAMLISPYEKMDMAKLDNLNIPIIQCADYMEPTALGRAEWMRFYGRLYGCTSDADSLFTLTSSRYAELTDSAKIYAKNTTPPTVLSDLCMGSVWYVPSSQSTVGKMYADAGATNPFADVKQNGSIAMAKEKVLLNAQHATVWLMKYDAEIKGTEGLDKLSTFYRQFDAYKSHNVWLCNTSTSRYFEETPFHPDWLLADYLTIFYNINRPTRYFKRICE